MRHRTPVSRIPLVLAGCLVLAACQPLALSMAALENMGIEFQSFGSFDAGEIIFARSLGRSVEVELEALSQRATRIRVSTRDGGFFYDGAAG
jgi:hypothetical protein